MNNVQKKNQLATFHAMRAAIGKRMHEARIARRMSLVKCARKAGVNPLVIDFYEMGKGDIPLSVMVKLAGALDMPLSALVENAAGGTGGKQG